MMLNNRPLNTTTSHQLNTTTFSQCTIPIQSRPNIPHNRPPNNFIPPNSSPNSALSRNHHGANNHNIIRASNNNNAPLITSNAPSMISPANSVLPYKNNNNNSHYSPAGNIINRSNIPQNNNSKTNNSNYVCQTTTTPMVQSEHNSIDPYSMHNGPPSVATSSISSTISTNNMGSINPSHSNKGEFSSQQYSYQAGPNKSSFPQNSQSVPPPGAPPYNHPQYQNQHQHQNQQQNHTMIPAPQPNAQLSNPQVSHQNNNSTFTNFPPQPVPPPSNSTTMAPPSNNFQERSISYNNIATMNGDSNTPGVNSYFQQPIDNNFMCSDMSNGMNNNVYRNTGQIDSAMPNHENNGNINNNITNNYNNPDSIPSIDNSIPDNNSSNNINANSDKTEKKKDGRSNIIRWSEEETELLKKALNWPHIDLHKRVPLEKCRELASSVPGRNSTQILSRIQTLQKNEIKRQKDNGTYQGPPAKSKTNQINNNNDITHPASDNSIGQSNDINKNDEINNHQIIYTQNTNNSEASYDFPN